MTDLVKGERVYIDPAVNTPLAGRSGVLIEATPSRGTASLIRWGAVGSGWVVGEPPHVLIRLTTPGSEKDFAAVPVELVLRERRVGR